MVKEKCSSIGKQLDGCLQQLAKDACSTLEASMKACKEAACIGKDGSDFYQGKQFKTFEELLAHAKATLLQKGPTYILDAKAVVEKVPELRSHTF